MKREVRLVGPSEILAWDMYFGSLVAFQLHPGNHQDPAKIDLQPYAELTDRMMEVRKARILWL